MPSPVEDRPGLLIRDSFQYSDAVLIVPPALVECLACFDGEHSTLDLRAMLVQLTGELQVSDLEEHLTDALSQSGFLLDQNYERLKDEAHRHFREAPVREPAHAGTGYPDQADELRVTMDEWMSPAGDHQPGLIGIAAPHVSPAGGYDSYRAAYSQLGPEYKDRTFIVLGTSHYGDPDKFGLTRKPYVTPFGAARTDIALVNELSAASGAIEMEDYCHSVEHSIEFQVLFLQSIYGPDINVVPILCGSFARSIYEGGLPENNDRVNRFLGTLGDIAAREKDRLFWILGIDMAHMGRRYGDEFDAVANEEHMIEVSARDRQRIERVDSGDAKGFWDLVQAKSRRSEVVRFIAALHFPESSAHRPWIASALRAMEHRSAERRQFRRNFF